MDGREFKQYELWKTEVQLLRSGSQHLQLELDIVEERIVDIESKDDG